jgi:hypothetical protein
MSHKILHTVGASDKYGYNNQPIYPEGYTKPKQKPLYPQRNAEIMAGRTPLSKIESKIPKSLRYVLLGRQQLKKLIG